MGRQAYATIPLATEMGDWRWETRERVVGRSVNDSFPDLMGLGSVLPRSGGTTGGTNGYFLPRSDGTIKKILALGSARPSGPSFPYLRVGRARLSNSGTNAVH